ncbi:sialate O-acetylesterase [Arachidicoccus ginsenosidivorans]|uniref:Sialate O-acetylesterase n=1 Tax=Arachidicoccus ginsenosidivorans TaxID=496057 RepID=A0A5B8VG06_9BACT|nr:sialate O-acetylesterase [Arachidicoccus ginsenosidivorans]
MGLLYVFMSKNSRLGRRYIAHFIKLIGLLLSLCITGTVLARGTIATGPDSSFHIYLLMGQSNMAGRGYLTDENKAIHNDHVLALNQNMQWEVAHNPLHYEKPNQDGVGPGLAFGMKMYDDAVNPNIKIGLVPCAVGGSPIEHWLPGAYDAATNTHPYDDAITRIKEAMKAGIIKGVIWHQGESDCTTDLAPNYMPQLYQLIANIRQEVGNAKLPFIVGELGRFYAPHNMINTQLPQLTEHLSDVGVVSSEGLSDRGDALHFNAVSADTLGKRYAVKMEQLEDYEPASISVDASTGDYSITSNITGWHFSGSIGQALTDITTASGNDEVGDYTKTSFSWDGGNKTGSIRWYKNSPVVIFDISLPNGQSGALKGFPNFTSMPSGMHPFSYHNDHFSWPEFQLNETSTPWLFFDDNKNACIISPASHFMVAKMEGDGASKITSTLNEDITSYPAGFSYSTIMVMDNGIRESWDSWGASLRDIYDRSFPDKDQDPLLKYYGYWTDNGAAYYYNYDTNLGYEQTLLNLKKYYDDNDIPIGYMQLDSWWYEKSNYSATGVKGPGYKNSKLPTGAWNLYGGLMDYVADPFVFPDELKGFQGKLGVPLVTHNRWVDPRSPYNEQYQVSGIMSLILPFGKTS